MTAEKVIKAAVRLSKNPDFALVMAHLAATQGDVVLAMSPENKDRLQMALIYYNALDAVVDLTKNIAGEAENG